jgi:hypothetical protein
MSENFKPSTTLGSGMFQWTAGEIYKTSLGGSFTTSIGLTTAVSAAVDNKFTLGPANSLKWAAETAVTFGKKFEYKDVDEIDFKKGSISILEYSGARCLDLFQASAGLGTIARGMFEAQRATAKTAMKVMVACDLVMAISNISMSGFGQGFEKGTAPDDSAAISWSVTGCQTLLALAPILMAFCSNYLSEQQKTTTPTDWNPNAIVQTSASKGVFIGAAPQSGLLPPSVASFIVQNDEGSNWTVFKSTVPPTLLAENIGLLEKKQHISGYDMLVPATMSSVNMTDQNVSIQTSVLDLEGKTGIGSAVRTGSKLTGLFAEIDLSAQQSPADKMPPNASLVLSASAAPSATLSAGAASPASSSVAVTGDALNLKSGATTSLKLNASSANLTASTAKVVAYDSLALNGTQIKITSVSGVTIGGALIRLG